MIAVRTAYDDIIRPVCSASTEWKVMISMFSHQWLTAPITKVVLGFALSEQVFFCVTPWGGQFSCATVLPLRSSGCDISKRAFCFSIISTLILDDIFTIFDVVMSVVFRFPFRVLNAVVFYFDLVAFKANGINTVSHSFSFYELLVALGLFTYSAFTHRIGIWFSDRWSPIVGFNTISTLFLETIRGAFISAKIGSQLELLTAGAIFKQTNQRQLHSYLTFAYSHIYRSQSGVSAASSGATLDYDCLFYRIMTGKSNKKASPFAATNAR